MSKPDIKKTDKPVKKGFNLLAQSASFNAAVQEALQGKVAIHSSAGLSIPHLAFQYFLGSRELPGGRSLEIIGADGSGKSTLSHTLLGWAMACNSPGCHIETENKPMDDDRIKRCYSTDRQLAELMFNACSRYQSFEITDVARLVLEWGKAIRDDPKSAAHVPLKYPGLVVVDTYSKLMNPSEALSFAAYGEDEKDEKGAKKKKKKAQELDEGSTFLHAKLGHKWTRQWPMMLRQYNLIVVIVSHQNDDTKASMGGGGIVLSPEQRESINRTTIGGNAFRQMDSYQMVVGKGLTDKAEVKGIRKDISQALRLTMTKNSYAEKRRLNYRINFTDKFDTDTHTTPVLDFSADLPDLLKSVGYKVSIHSKTEVSSADLKFNNGSFAEFERHIMTQPELIEEIGQRLNIVGYLPPLPVQLEKLNVVAD